MTHHPQVQASRALVDEGMVPLLELLWERGYETEFSCQGGEEYKRQIKGEIHILDTTDAYLLFANFDDGVRFLREVYDADFCVYPKLEMFPSCNGRSDRRARVIWHHTLTEKIFQGLMAMVMAS